MATFGLTRVSERGLKMSVEEDFEEWYEMVSLPRGGVNYNIAKAAWRRCATLQKERHVEELKLDCTKYNVDMSKMFTSCSDKVLIDYAVAAEKMTSDGVIFDEKLHTHREADYSDMTISYPIGEIKK